MERYSNLEVDPNQNRSSHTPQSAAAAHADWPHAVPDAEQTQKEAVPQNDLPEVVQQKDNSYGEQGAYNPAEEGMKGRICGLRKRTFYIILVVAILVVCGAIAGGVAGGVTANRGSKSKGSSSGSGSSGSSNSTTNPSAKNLLSSSMLSAINWTDTNSIEHRIVVFQDPYNSIVARRYDSQNKTWETSNITAVMGASTTPLDPIPGTALAVAGLDSHSTNAYGIHLFFLDPGNILASVQLDDPLNLPDKWQNESLNNAMIETYPGSKLAATWQRCPAASGLQCIGNWVVAYQSPGTGAISITNHSDWATTTQAVDGSSVTTNSSLAIIPQFGGVSDQLGLATESYDSASSGSLQLSSYSDDGDWSGVGSALVTNITLPATTQQFAATRVGWNAVLYLALMNDGSLKGSWTNGTKQSSLGGISLPSGHNTNFSAIATTLDGDLFGISDDSISWYTVKDNDPRTFQYSGQVFP